MRALILVAGAALACSALAACQRDPSSTNQDATVENSDGQQTVTCADGSVVNAGDVCQPASSNDTNVKNVDTPTT